MWLISNQINDLPFLKKGLIQTSVTPEHPSDVLILHFNMSPPLHPTLSGWILHNLRSSLYLFLESSKTVLKRYLFLCVDQILNLRKENKKTMLSIEANACMHVKELRPIHSKDKVMQICISRTWTAVGFQKAIHPRLHWIPGRAPCQV